MSAGFGFSVGDIVAGLKLIKQSIEALQDTKGSSADFQALSHELDSLKDGLEAVEDLHLDQRFGVKSKQSVAIQEAVSRCWHCINTFLSTISRYQPWLQTKALPGPVWKANLKKIQWALCKKDDVNRLRIQLERHCSSIISAFHLDFINCAEAFLAVLKIRFKQHGVEERGLKMLDDSQFVLEDIRGKLDLTKPWLQIMRPNQKVDMSMIFQRGVPWSVCPGCMNENDVAFETSENEPEVIRNSLNNETIVGFDNNGRRPSMYSSSDLIDQFRRVQLVYTYLPSEVESETYAELSNGNEAKITDIWSRKEREAFYLFIGVTGTDWRLLSKKIGTKSPTQVRPLAVRMEWQKKLDDS
ncbi:MAG: hypothetical protein Q9201_005300 [Fulgogasparrea decipioides]